MNKLPHNPRDVWFENSYLLAQNYDSFIFQLVILRGLDSRTNEIPPPDQTEI